MDLDYDAETDVAYVRLRDLPTVSARELDTFRRLDCGEDGEPVGIRLADVRNGVEIQGLPDQRAVSRLLAQRGIRRRVATPHRPVGLLPLAAATAVVGVLTVALLERWGAPAWIGTGSQGDLVVVAGSVLLSVYLVVRFLRSGRHG
jgi:uncharacterized protein YuzE